MNRITALASSIGLAAAASDALTAERTLVLTIENMHCETCPLPVAGAIDKGDGVLDLALDAVKGRVTVTYDDSITNWETIASAADQEGYQARRVLDAPVIAVGATAPHPKSCRLWGAPSRRDVSTGVIHGKIERVDKRCLARARRASAKR